MQLMAAQLGSFHPEHTFRHEAGELAIGHVGPDHVPIRVYMPYDYSPIDGSKMFVEAIGLLALTKQYNHQADSLMEDNDAIVVIGHDHRHHRWPIRANSQDIIAVRNELEIESFIAVGHSMGTLATLLALSDKQFADATELLIQVNPPMTGSHLAYKPEDLFNMVREGVLLTKEHPFDAINFAAGAISECVRRPFVITKQFARLASGVVHDRYAELTNEHPDKNYIVIYNDRDGLVPPRWNESMRGQNLTVLLHRSKTGLAHAAINEDPEFAHGLHALAHHEPIPESFMPLYEGERELVDA